MGRAAVCSNTRRTGLLVAIICVCMCSLLMSMYYVHNVQHPSPAPMELMIRSAQEHWKQQLSDYEKDFFIESDDRTVNDDPITYGMNSSEDGNSGNPKLVHHIDYGYYLETRQTENVKQDEGGVKEKPTEKTIKDISYFTTKMPHPDMWPVHGGKKWAKMGVRYSDPLYEKPVRTRKNWNGERYIVYLCNSDLACAGWGDRQHGILAVYLFSLVTNRTFKVDFTSPCPLNKLFHPRIHNWTIDPMEFDGLSSTHLNVLSNRTFLTRMREIDFNEHYPQDVVYMTVNYDYFYALKVNPFYRTIFRKKVRGRPRPIMFADLWQKIFKMNKRVVRRFTPALAAARLNKKHKLVCAHIRFGRNPTIPNDSEVRNTLSSIKPLWDFLKLRSDPNRYRLFIASDWDGFRKKVNHLYKNIAIDVEGDIVHIDRIKTSSKLEDQSQNYVDSYCDGLEKVVVDQYILSQCDVLLLTYSGFGKGAAYLRRSNQDLYLMDKGKLQNLVLIDEKKQKKHS